MSDLSPIAGKLSRLIRLLASDKEGEVVATAAAINRMLRSAGADIHTLADRVAHTNGGAKLSEAEMKQLYDAGFNDGLLAAENQPHGTDFHNTDGSPVWNEVVEFCQRRGSRLSTREQEFVDSVAAQLVYREPTEKQAKWLKSIFLRLGGKRP